MAELTFRDFAGAIMRGDDAGAATTLTTLLGIADDQARASTAHFRSKMAEPSFMPKAMGLRTAVTTGSDVEITALLGDCFALEGDVAATALATLRTRYPRPA